ncbi:MAG: helix-turn-helix domain-containing protein [Candidatus Scalindua sp.]
MNTNIDKRKKGLIKKLKNKEYREAFVSEHIDTGIPFQIRALRNQRKWTQKDLAEHTEMKQEHISRLEDPNYSKFTLATLKRLAAAFDVGLIVRFTPVSDLVKWELELTSESLKAVSFDQDSYFEDRSDEIDSPQGVAASLLDTIEAQTGGLSTTVTNIISYLPRVPAEGQANVQTDVLRAVQC